jgi:hypothetical protein
MSSLTYRISRAGNSVGEFELPQVKQMLDSGVLLPSDHAWTAGMQEWQTLAVLFPAMSPPALPPRAPATPPPAPAAPAAQPPAPTGQPTAPNPFVALLVPLGRSGWAILAGYLGLVSVLVLPAPFAILCGVLAIKDIRKNPHKLGLVRAWFGIIAGSIGLIALFVLIVAASIKK